jgi:hypothetical protein
MKKKLIKASIWSASILGFLIIVLAIHIYVVTRPKVDAHTVVMARIDIKQAINQDDANKIGAWLYTEKGIDHVLVNPKTDIVIFTFYPLKTTANQVVSDFKSTFNYKAERYLPSEEEIASSCPASNSVSFKAYNFFKKIF